LAIERGYGQLVSEEAIGHRKCKSAKSEKQKVGNQKVKNQKVDKRKNRKPKSGKVELAPAASRQDQLHWPPRNYKKATHCANTHKEPHFFAFWMY
jgi:hypothetical protein